MTPTRELARQVYLEAKTFLKLTPVRVISVYGGLSVQSQLADLKKGA
jgi:superfamily II DNA/RNA helicase